MIQALEANFQKIAEQQFTKFSAKLDEQVTRLDTRVDQLQSSTTKSSVEVGNSSHQMETTAPYRDRKSTRLNSSHSS